MFIGSWLINFVISMIAFLFVFIGSMATNGYFTSFTRAILGFIFFYFITYFFRWIWFLASKETSINNEEKIQIEDQNIGKDTINREDYSDEDIVRASEYVKDLIND